MDVFRRKLAKKEKNEEAVGHKGQGVVLGHHKRQHLLVNWYDIYLPIPSVTRGIVVPHSDGWMGGGVVYPPLDILLHTSRETLYWLVHQGESYYIAFYVSQVLIQKCENDDDDVDGKLFMKRTRSNIDSLTTHSTTYLLAYLAGMVLNDHTPPPPLICNLPP